jgi:hypothetical protein
MVAETCNCLQRKSAVDKALTYLARCCGRGAARLRKRLNVGSFGEDFEQTVQVAGTNPDNAPRPTWTDLALGTVTA